MTERVLGPTGGRRRKWALLLAPLAALSLMLVFALGASANALPGSKFEIDDPSGTVGANLTIEANCTTTGSGGTNCIDWNSVTEIRQSDAPTGQNDDSYQGGVKEDTACPATTTGSIPNNKSDLLTFGSYFESEAGGPGWLHVYWQRVQEPSGTTNMDFEFNKSTTDCDGAGESKNVTRTVGDILLQFDVDQGGAVAHLSKRTWLGGAWSDATDLNTTDAIGSINQVAITTAAAGGSGGLGAMSPRTFGEASFDLSQVFDPTKCESFGSAMLKSRSSDSFTSQLKDFIAPIPVNITNCGTVIIRKVTQPTGETQLFDYTKSFSTDPSSTNTFQLADGQSQTFNGVLFGNGYTVTEGTLPTSWEFVSLSCSASSASVPAGDRVVSGQTVTFKIDNAADILDCTYTNRLQQGAIKITKESIKTVGGVNVKLAGAEFSVEGHGTQTTGSDGTVCVDGLAWGDYDVQETKAPDGYAIDDDTVHTITVNNNAKCSDSPFDGETFTASDTPLTDILVRATSQATGGTASSISCVDSATPPADIGNSPDPDTGYEDPAEVTAEDLVPGTYTCTIIVDP